MASNAAARPVVGRLPVTYLLPLRWTDGSGLDELTGYLAWLSERVDVLVVDGSPARRYASHARAFGRFVRHHPVSPELGFRNGKVNGVLTGLRLARYERILIADDDVRYDDAALAAVCHLLGGVDLVRPQNYFDPLPWHARWDTARTLINRCFGADYPGTLGVRRSTLLRMGGYDGDVLFENLELIRSVRCRGGTERSPLDLYVRRRPPSARQFCNQRVRQAYDDLAQPVRLVTFLSVLPLLAVRPAATAVLLVASAVVTAAVGRHRAGGASVFPASSVALAPLWVLERAVCVWVAVALRVTRGGVRYGGHRIRVAAHAGRTLARNRT